MSSRQAESSSGSFCAVKCKEAKLVAPSLPPTARDCIYWLSNLDQIPLYVNVLFFYQPNKINKTADPVIVLQKALAQVLLHYYPLAGRLEFSSDGKCHVISSGEGAVFVEAEADATISDVLAQFELDTNMEYAQKLICKSAWESNNVLDRPMLSIQVTRFKCGGFCVGAGINHYMCDGVAFSEFLNSLGEIARGVSISIQPALDRTLLKARDPLQIEFPHFEYTEIVQNNSPTADDPSVDDIVYSSLCFDSKHIALMKKHVLGEGLLNTCTSFEVMSAFIWRIRTKALGVESSEMTKLLFAVDGRSRLCPPLPEGYHGNAVMTACSIASARELTDLGLSYAVKLVQEAKAMINDKYMRSKIDYFEKTSPRRSPTAGLSIVSSAAHYISSWSRLPFHKADYGWGQPIHYFPVEPPTLDVTKFLPYGKDSKGIKVYMALPSFAWNTVKSILQQHQNQQQPNPVFSGKLVHENFRACARQCSLAATSAE
ncbi:hypothetical protein O6H91_14G075300 [Diphasiastrum complanatum]|uniref:Uncharacterized protein n=2 Tax=Diphasiastrum complanatum TaxID=34168 RepID=A0ACC2BQZ3_DIPCM|nr:hypothetical protein O6H91_14G075200 [Diphasiastrum complanatum]KAJ7532186.1 hypothetical protein O6H91_14G075300 [Diphasiastrum complanatum]